MALPRNLSIGEEAEATFTSDCRESEREHALANLEVDIATYGQQGSDL